MAWSVQTSFFQDGASNIESLGRRRNSSIEPDLHQRLSDFLLRHTIGERTLHVIAQLRTSAKRRENRHGEHAASLVVDHATVPGITKALLGDDFLEWPPERRGVVQRILTKSPDHPHGIKVMLENGVVGRVKEILSEPASK